MYLKDYALKILGYYMAFTVKQVTKIVYFCGICNAVIPDTLHCKSCKHQFLEDVEIE